MKRRFEHLAGKKFYIAYNNGVYAIADETSYHALLVGKHLIETASVEVSTWNVFTFVRSERHKRDHWFIGTHEMFERLIQELEASDAKIIRVGRDMYVPFSNGGLPHQSEWRFIRRESDFFKVFGIQGEELRERGA